MYGVYISEQIVLTRKTTLTYLMSSVITEQGYKPTQMFAFLVRDHIK
jgi:hypothetical protein